MTYEIDGLTAAEHAYFFGPEWYEDDDADAALDAAEAQYWATHEIWYDDGDKPYIKEK